MFSTQDAPRRRFESTKPRRITRRVFLETWQLNSFLKETKYRTMLALRVDARILIGDLPYDREQRYCHMILNTRCESAASIWECTSMTLTRETSEIDSE